MVYDTQISIYIFIYISMGPQKPTYNRVPSCRVCLLKKSLNEHFFWICPEKIQVFSGTIASLVGSLDHFLLFESWSQLTNIFQRGWNHQPDMFYAGATRHSCCLDPWPIWQDDRRPSRYWRDAGHHWILLDVSAMCRYIAK